MIVSYKNEFIWIKGRKSASSSIELALNKLCGSGDIYNKLREHQTVQNNIDVNFSDMIEGRKYGLKPHARARGIQKKLINHHKLLTQKQWKSFFKFTVERHPFDKVVSLYYYFIKKNKNMTFDGFIRSGKFKKCYNYPLYTNKKGDVIVDFIIKYESLDNGIRHVEEKIGHKLELFNENVWKIKNRKTPEELLTDEYKDIIYKTFKKEFDLHRYHT